MRSCTRLLAECVDDEVNELPHLRGHVVSGDVIDVERESFVRPVREDVDERPASKMMLKPQVDDLRNSETRQARAQLGPESVTVSRPLTVTEINSFPRLNSQSNGRPVEVSIARMH